MLSMNRRAFLFLVSGFLLAGYLSFVLMTAVCPFGAATPDHHRHDGPIQHEHTSLCEWAHAVGALFLVVFFGSFRIFLRIGQLLFPEPFLRRGGIGLPRFGRAPPFLFV
jgi:hypothetical protein